jgi:ABC-type uncharacterized transport system ATPase subunit
VYEDLTVFENLRDLTAPYTWRLSVADVSTLPEVVDRIHAMAEQIFLIECMQDRAGQLSHGQNSGWKLGCY